MHVEDDVGEHGLAQLRARQHDGERARAALEGAVGLVDEDGRVLARKQALGRLLEQLVAARARTRDAAAVAKADAKR